MSCGNIGNPKHAKGGDILYTNRRDDLIALAARQALPTVYMWSEFTAAGGLIAYGNSLAEGYRQVGT
jgi:putative ABC transport system substrate-binding protein